MSPEDTLNVDPSEDPDANVVDPSEDERPARSSAAAEEAGFGEPLVDGDGPNRIG